jgi:hypothetical protein
MKGIAFTCIYGLMAMAGLAGHAYAQASQAPAKGNTSQGGGQSPLSQVGGLAGLPGAGARISVTLASAIDSNSAGGGQYAATVKNAANLGNLQIPAGASAVVKLVAGGQARTWTVVLASIAAGGQTIAVSGGSPALGAGSATAAASNAVQNKLKGLLGGGKQTQPAAASPIRPSVMGARVYLPAGSEVVFTGVQSPAAGAAPAQQAAIAQQNAGPPTAEASAPVAQGAPTAQGPPTAQGQTGPLQSDPTPAPATASAATVVYENMRYQLQGCQREAPHIVCRIQITNLNNADVFPNDGQGTYYIDQTGARHNATLRRIANCVGWGQCQVVPNIAMAGSYEFLDEQGQTTQLVRLQIHLSGKAVAQFTNVPIQ